MSLVSDFLHDAKLLTFLCETFDEFFHRLAVARFHFIIGSHCYPFASFDHTAEDVPKADKSTPGSLGATPSRAFAP